MRGMFLPTAVLFFLFAKYHRRLLPAWPAAGRTAARRLAGLALIVALAATSWGTLRMLGGLMYISLTSTSGFYRLIGRAVPPHLQLPYRELARDGALRSYRPNAEDRHTVWKYHAEKLVDRLEPDEMADWEKERCASRAQDNSLAASWTRALHGDPCAGGPHSSRFRPPSPRWRLAIAAGQPAEYAAGLTDSGVSPAPAGGSWTAPSPTATSGITSRRDLLHQRGGPGAGRRLR
jgi:hypothetical protein